MIARHREGRWRLTAASLPMLFAGTCLAAQATLDGESASGASQDLDRSLAPRCSEQFHEARLISKSAAVVPDAIWDRKPAWNATVRFRIDEHGAPVSVRATVTNDVDGKYALERFTAEALGRYRFCLPQDAVADSRWVLHMRFAYRRLGTKDGNVEMYVQQFVPSYTRAEYRERRAGVARVRGTFAPDGHATSVDVVESSGDAALDAKSLEAMADYLLVFRDGAVVAHPVVFVQPYDFRPQ